MERSFFAVFFISLASTVVAEEVYGPYHYRIGNEQTHSRFSTTFTVDSSSVLLGDCVSTVINREKTGSGSCWETRVETFGQSDGLILIENGYDFYVIDTRSGELSILDGSFTGEIYVSGVKPSSNPNWANVRLFE